MACPGYEQLSSAAARMVAPAEGSAAASSAAAGSIAAGCAAASSSAGAAAASVPAAEPLDLFGDNPSLVSFSRLDPLVDLALLLDPDPDRVDFELFSVGRLDHLLLRLQKPRAPPLTAAWPQPRPQRSCLCSSPRRRAVRPLRARCDCRPSTRCRFAFTLCVSLDLPASAAMRCPRCARSLVLELTPAACAAACAAPCLQVASVTHTQLRKSTRQGKQRSSNDSKKKAVKSAQFFQVRRGLALPGGLATPHPKRLLPRRTHAPPGNGLRRPRQVFFYRYTRSLLLQLCFFWASSTATQIRTRSLAGNGRGGSARE